MNARSLANKLSSFHFIVYSTLPSVIAVTETWLSSSYYNNEVLPTGYSIIRQDRPTRGGGVLLATISHIPSIVIYSNTSPDILTIKLLLHSPILISAIYIPPSSSDSLWSFLISYLSDLFQSDCPIVVVGDFNCPDINWDTLSATNHSSSRLCNLMFDFNLSQCVTEPTHIKGNILDLVLINSADILSEVTVSSPLSTSDHFSLSFNILTKSYRPTSNSSSSFLNYTKADFLGMCDFLLDWDFSSCYASDNVEVIWSEIKSAISTAIDAFVPSSTIPRHHSHLPRWFNASIRHRLKQFRSVRRSYISNPTSTRKQKLSDLESDLQRDISNAKEEFVSALINKSVTN